MADYQKVEVVKDQPTEAFSEEDLANLEQSEETQQIEEPVQERPEWLPEKFNSAEDFAQAYSELEAAYTQSRQGNESGEEGVEEVNDVSGPISAESLNEFSSEFFETGDVSEESRKAIVDMGIPREYVDAYISGQQAVLKNHFDGIYSEVGGEESYNKMTSWAAENLPEGEQEAFNNAVSKGNPDEIMFAIRSLHSRWMAAGNAPRDLLQGNTSSEFSGSGFRSLAELTEAMKDPRYAKDAAYRQDIETRLNNSNIL